MRSIIKKINGGVVVLEKTLLGLIFTLLIVLAFFQVAARNLFSYSLSGADELLTHAVLWIGFIGASLATSRKRHIKIDALSRLFSAAGRDRVDLVVSLAAAAICSFLLYASIDFIAIEIEYGETIPSLSLPVWYFELVFPFTFGLSALRYSLFFLDDLISVVRGGAREEGP